MFSKLFKPRWQNRDPRVRLQAIEVLDLTKPDDVAVLEQLAQNDNIASVRQAALGRIGNSQTLLRLLAAMPADEAFAADKKCAMSLLVAQIKAGKFTAQAMTQASHQYPGLALTTLFAQYAPTEMLLPWLLMLPQTLQLTPLQVLELARLSRDLNAINQAIEAITDSESLQQLSKQAGHLDKRSNQLVRARLKALRDAEAALQTQREQQEKLVQRAEALARAAHHPLYGSELAYLQQQWSQDSAPVAELQARIDTAFTTCTQKHQQTPIAAESQAADNAVAAQTSTDTQDIASDESLLTKAPADTAEHTALREQEAQRHAERLAEKQVRHEQHQQKQQMVGQEIEKLLLALEQAIAEKRMRPSADYLKKVRQQLGLLDSKHASAYAGKLQLLQAQYSELEQWQEYAVLPKLEALCVAMEQLVDADLAVPEKANAIRALQDQWRAMKLPPANHAQDLWTRFKLASDSAYAPCAVYFAREKEQREFNLAQRVTICAALEEFNTQDWAKADWKAVEKVIATAKREFFQFHPIPRDDEKSIKSRFDKALDAIVEQQTKEFAHNESLKKALVDTVKSLLDGIANTDSTKDALMQSMMSTAIARCQQLQKDWKTIKPGRRGPDQALWTEFQHLCNAVFAKRNAVNDQRRHDNELRQQAQAEAHKAAQELCAQIEHLKLQSDSELKQSREQFQALQEQFNALGDIGDKQRISINQRFYAACDGFKQHVAGFSTRQQQRQQQELLHLADICQQLEYTHETAQIETLQQQWADSKASAEQKALLHDRYARALAIARGECESNFADNEHLRRRICIELEIATGSETPDADRNLRREMQLQLLSKGLGQTATNKSALIEKLHQQWLCTGAAKVDVQAQLQARFAQVIAKR